jgi:tubulin-specific chaperone E
LRWNELSRVYSPLDSANTDSTPFRFSATLRSLDIAYNKITSWSFVNALPNIFPGLSSLCISNNPLYDQPVASSKVTNTPEKLMTADEAFMLTLARLPSLTSLNYSKISQQDRANGELYYLSLIGKELSAFSQSEEKAILAQHSRYKALCEIYSEPIIKRATDTGAETDAVHPRSVAARLINFTFYLASAYSSSFQPTSENTRTDEIKMRKEYKREIPKTVDTYRIKSLVSHRFNLPPLSFRLIWETEEWDPMGNTVAHMAGEDEWDSSSSSSVSDGDDNDDRTLGWVATSSDESGRSLSYRTTRTGHNGNKLIKREVELVNSTHQVGFLFDDDIKDVLVRIEPL